MEWLSLWLALLCMEVWCHKNVAVLSIFSDANKKLNVSTIQVKKEIYTYREPHRRHPHGGRYFYGGGNGGHMCNLFICK